MVESSIQSSSLTTMTDSNPRQLILIDGSSFLFRAFHALPPLTNSHKEPTGAILGVANMLRKMLKEYPTPYFVVVFDAKGKTFRHDLYPDYKANRPPMPEDLREQIEPLHQLVTAMGLPMVIESGVEADDVIGTLATTAAADGFSVVISTGDKDMAQLVNQQVTLENSMSNSRMDHAGVVAKFDVRPDQIIDYLALIGDTSDNIPGVPKVGPKTAAKWLKQYDSLEQIVASADQIKGKVGENLRSVLEQIPLSQQLATIHCDVGLEVGLEALQRVPTDHAALRKLLTRFEFSAWLKQLDETAPDEADVASEEEQAVAADYQAITTQKQLNRWLKRLKAAELFAFDTETTSLDYHQARIVGVSFAIEAGEAAYLPLAHDYPGVPDQLDRDKVLEQLRPLLEDPNCAKVGQNLKYDANVLANHGIELRGIVHDTMLQSYVLDSTATRHNMDALALKYLGHHTIHYEDVAGKGAKQIPFQAVALEQAVPYAAEDADITLRLHQKLWPQLKQQEGLCSVYQTLEVPLIPVLSRIERNGVLIDCAMLEQQSRELAEQMVTIQQQAFDLAGESFNLNSPKQIQQILFEKMKIPVIKKTPKGQPSTAESVLQELALDYPLPQQILDYRSLSKLKSTYTDRLPEQVDPVSGRIHSSYHQAVAATGRLSSSDPNLQNIPVRSEQGRRIRQAFIAPPDHTLVAADYSQIELRIMAHLSADQRLMQAFSEGLDVHSATAAELFGLLPDEVSRDQRRSAKAINFGLIYGMSAFGLANQLGVARGEAQNYIDRYFDRYTGVKEYMDRTRELAHQQGYVETLFGRRLYLPEINSRNGQRRQYAERTAINAPMQGTAADIIKRAMISIDHWIVEQKPLVRMVMQVHDELVFEVANQALDEAIGKIEVGMASAAELSVPLVVDVGYGLTWHQAHG